MDYERDQIFVAIKQLLYDYNIIDTYINEHTYSIDYTMITDKITVDLTINIYSKNNLFDDILLCVKYEDMPEIFCENKIIDLIKIKLYHFKSSSV